MIQKRNAIYLGAENKPSLYDASIPENWNKELIVFIHGYMGFKDWGAWNLVMNFFNKKRYGFLKYNVSHNGCSIENPTEFVDLNSFRKNNYMKEIEDFESIMAEIGRFSKKPQKIHLIGHSRGGGIALLQSRHASVDSICTWAAIASIEDRFPKGKDLEEWKKNGVYYRFNGRTQQNMPHDYNQYENFLQNKERLNIKKYCINADIPIQVIHGTNDYSVSLEEGRKISDWAKTKLIEINDTQHTFDSKHPWKEDQLPQKLKEVCQKTLNFFKNI